MGKAYDLSNRARDFVSVRDSGVVDDTAQIAVVGNTESTVSIGVKAGATFTAADGTRNSAMQSQAVTADTAVTYPLVIGHYIPNADKGAASTITRCAGSYIVQQTQGGTANANLMIDAGSSTVPAGTWSIYNDSTRVNLFKGPLNVASAYTPPISVTNAGTITVNCSLSNVFYVTMQAGAGSDTFATPTNPSDGQTVNVFITQNSTGNRTMTWPASSVIKWSGASTLTASANAIDLLVMTYRGTVWYATLTKGFA